MYGDGKTNNSYEIEPITVWISHKVKLDGK